MPARVLTLLAIVALAATPGRSTRAQDGEETVVLVGRVLDAGRLPISGAEVLIAGVGGSVRSGVDGRFRINGLLPGVLTVTVRRLGFAPTTLTRLFAGGERAMELTLIPLPHMLATFHVRARQGPVYVDHRLVAFNRRRASAGGGTFITREDIERTRARDMSDLLRMMPGFRVTRDRREQMRVSSRGNASNCRMRFVLDGVPVAMIDNNVDLMVRVEDVEAAEFYRGASTAPVEFAGVDRRGESSCGMIVVWTRQK